MRRIAVEEHFATREQLDVLQSLINKTFPKPEVIQQEKNIGVEAPFLVGASHGSETVVKKLLDIGEGRIEDMDEAGVDVQVLSPIIGAQVLDAAGGVALARKVNDTAAKTLKRHPERFVGLATLAPQNPAEAANELKRAVKDLGFRGAMVNSHTKGEYLDDQKYWPIFEMAANLEVPLYIHPRVPPAEMLKYYLAYPGLASAILGFSHEVSLHTLCMVFSGVFDRFSTLNIILGHLGEALPYWLGRIDSHWLSRPASKHLKKKPSDYLKENFFITSSGMFWEPPMMCACAAVGADRIMFAVDYPMESIKPAVAFLDSASMSHSDREKIYHQNAEKLFKL